MKKYMVYAAIIALAACGGKDEKPKEEPAKLEALAKSKNSPAFNASFGKVMEDYFHLKDNFITESDTSINFYARKMAYDIDSLKLSELKDDAAIVETAKSFAAGLASEAKGLAGEKDLKAKRKAFNMVTDQLFNLMRTVKYDQAKVYYQECPMAFKDEDGVSAYWLSKDFDIKNPYRPKDGMLTCGNVADSLDYRQQ